MQIKFTLKIIVLTLLSIFIIGVGYVTYRKLSYNKKVFETDIRAFVPLSSNLVLQINKEKDLKRLIPYFANLPEIYSVLIDTRLFNYPTYIVEDNLGLLVLTKQTDSQKNDIQKVLRSSIFPEFPPKEKNYKDALIQFYTTADRDFFCCMFYNGIFAASYNYKQLESIVDTDNKKHFFRLFDKITNEEKIKSTYCANLYLKDSISVSAFNISVDSVRMKLEGYSIESVESSDNREVVESDVDFNIFPNEALNYKIDVNNNFVDVSIQGLFEDRSYSFYLGASQSPVYVLKHKGSRFQVYNMLNDMEVKNIGRRFYTRDFAFSNQRIYTASNKLSLDIFKSEVPIYLTFYKDYLIFSDNKDKLIFYLKNNGNYSPLTNEDTIWDSNLISFTKKSLEESTNVGGFLFSDSVNAFYIKELREDSTMKKIEIILNN